MLQCKKMERIKIMVSNNRKSFLILFVSFAITIVGFWIVPDSFYFTFYMLLPLSILVTAIIMCIDGCSFARGVAFSLIVGISCMGAEYLTLSLSNMINNHYSKWNLYRIPNMPQFDLILIGGVIFLLGWLVGRAFRSFRRN